MGFSTPTSNEKLLAATPLIAYPNPVKGDLLRFNKEGNYSIFNMVGQQLARVEKTNQVNIAQFEPGMYIVRFDKNQVVQFIRR